MEIADLSLRFDAQTPQDALHLQNLGGWTSLEMVQHYAQMVDDDLLREHKADSPIDNLDRLK